MPAPRGISAARLEEFHWIAGRVVQNGLCTAWPGHNIIRAEGNPSPTQPCNFRSEVGHLQVHSIPAARYLPATVW